MSPTEVAFLERLHAEVIARIDLVNDKLDAHIKRFEEHVGKDEAVHQVVDRHSIYFTGFSLVFAGVWAAILAWFKSWPH